MKKNYIILLVAILLSGITFAQEAQKNFINYQGVARNGADQLMANESMTIGIALKMGSATGASGYAENHSVTTDANGVFSLKIGNGDAVSGEYNTIPWGSEATFVTVLINGSEIGTTEMMAVPYALSSGDGSQTATEVPYSNIVSGLTATNAQEAIDELVGSGAVDADADPTNEFQMLNFDAVTNELSLSDGNSIIIPSGGTDADADPTNELQTISFDAASSEISLTDGGTITIPSGGTDADADPANELQNLSLDGTNLEISDGTGVDLAALIPPGGTDDQNASEVPFDNSTSTLTATDTQAALEELAAGGLVDTDDQNLSLTGTLLQISDGTGVDLAPIIPPGGTDDQNAGEVPYDNTVSALAATDTQAAIDELASGAIGGSSLWDLNGTDINYGTGNVGINTVAPTARLDIKHNSTLTIPQLRLEETEVDYARLEFKSAATGFWHIAGRGGDSGDVSRLNFYHHNGTIGRDLMTIAGSGDIGIGTTAPTAKAHVHHNSNLASPQLRLEESTDDYSRLEFKNQSTGFWHVAGRGGDTGDVSRLNFYHHNGTIGRDLMTIAGSGNVGIGTASPQAPFDIAGQNNWDLNTTEGDFRLGNDTYRLKMSTSLAGAGAGNARIRSQGGSNKLLLGSGSLDVLSIVDNNVGIGTIDPTIELDVVGSIRSSDLSGAGQRNVMADTDGNLVIGSSGGGGALSFPFYEEVTETGAAFHVQNNTGASGYGLVGSKGPGAEVLPSNTAGVFGRATNGHGVYGHSENDFYAGVMGISETDLGSGVLGFGFGGGIGGYFYTTSLGRAALSTGVGNVGFGTQNPTAKTHVLHNSNIATPQLRLEESEADYARLEFKNLAAGFWHIAGRGGDTGDVSRLNFYHHNGSVGRDFMTIAGSGNVGIGTTAPAAKLDVAGDIKTSGEVHGPASGSANMIPIAYGQITGPGLIDSGSGNFSVVRTATGTYEIRIPDSGSTFDWVISATRHSAFPGHISVIASPLLLEVTTYNILGNLIDNRFSFIVYTP